MYRSRIADLVDWTNDPANSRRLAWAVFMVASVARVAVVLAVRDWVDPQDWEYGHIARNMLAGKGFSGSAWFLAEGKTAFMAPVYVYLLYGCRVLFGAAGYAVLQILQGVVGGVSAVLLYYIARRAYDQRTAFLAGSILAIYPTHLFLTTLIHPLVLITALLLASVLLSHVMAEKRSAMTAVALGAVLGVASLTDPAIMCYAPLAVGWPLVARPRAWKQGLRLAALGLVVAAVVVAPWTVRNYLVFDRFVLIKSPFGFALWVGNHEGATGTQTLLNENGEVEHVNAHMPEAFQAQIAAMPEPDAYNAFGKRAVAYMAEHPIETVARTARKAFYYWWYPTWLTCPRCHRGGVLTQFHHPEKVPWVIALCLAAAGVVGTRKRWRHRCFLLAPLVCYTALYAITSVGNNSRYRFPVECLVLVFCAAALEPLLRAAAPKSLSLRDDADTH